MSFGERLQALRKAKGLSQEQLAEGIAVSRQAVSKWETGESLPDTDKLLPLSRMLEVSVDALLREEGDPVFPAADSARGEAADSRGNAAGAVGTGLLIAGLLVSVIGWEYWQTMPAAGAGLLLQIAGAVLFPLLLRGRREGRLRRRFYTAAVWLIAPFPVLWFAGFLCNFYPKPRAHWTEYAVSAVLYLLVCGLLSLLLHRRRWSEAETRRDFEKKPGGTL